MPTPLQQAKAAVAQIEKIRDDIEKTVDGMKAFQKATKKTIDAFMARTEGKPCYEPFRKMLLKAFKIIESKVKAGQDMFDYAEWVWDLSERGLNGVYEAERLQEKPKVINDRLSTVLKALNLAERIHGSINKLWGILLDWDFLIASTIEEADKLCD